MNRALVVGGNSGIGRAVVIDLLGRGIDHIDVVDKIGLQKDRFSDELLKTFTEKTTEHQLNLCHEEYDLFDTIKDIDTLVITAGFGRVTGFEDLSECEINNLIKCNELAIIQIIKKYYHLIHSHNTFYCAVMVSIAGHIVSPLFSVYGAAKSGLAMFIENINVELAAQGYKNRIMDCSPGSIKGTAFNGKESDYTILTELASEIVNRMYLRETLFIPQYEELYKGIIEKYNAAPSEFGESSYWYKVNNNRINRDSQVTIGYLSGTFDLFHIGHLNLLRRAKQACDYLIVGVHESGAWKGKETFIPFEERKEIIGACKYVDKVVQSFPEDSDAWDEWHYDKLFVGSDYKGSERFNRYERILKDKGVEIIYLPYTLSTSSTQIRKTIIQKTKDN